MEKEYTEYAILEAQIAELTAQRDKKKKIIMADMIERGAKNEETELGKFNIATLKSWTYSDDLKASEKTIKASITELSDDIKALKAKEEEDDIATCEERPSLRFTAIKI